MKDFKQLHTYYDELYKQLSEEHRQAVKLEREVESEDVRVVFDFLADDLKHTIEQLQQLLLDLKTAERRGY